MNDAEDAHVRRPVQTIAMDERPDRRIGRAEDPDGGAAYAVVRRDQPLVRGSHRVEHPDLVVFAVVVLIPQCWIERIVVKIDDVFRLFCLAKILTENQRALIRGRLRPITAAIQDPVIRVVGDTDHELLARNAAQRALHDVAIPRHRRDRPRLAALAVLVVRHDDHEVADLRRLTPIHLLAGFEIGADTEMYRREVGLHPLQKRNHQRIVLRHQIFKVDVDALEPVGLTPLAQRHDHLRLQRWIGEEDVNAFRIEHTTSVR